MNIIREERVERTIPFEEMYKNEQERADNLELKCKEASIECDARKRDLVEFANRAEKKEQEMKLEIARLQGIIEGYEKFMRMYWS